jgi:hypothetical protein
MNKQELKGFMARAGDTQESLASAMCISLSRLNAKINEYAGAEFTQSEIAFIAQRYSMTPEDVSVVFFAKKVSE